MRADVTLEEDGLGGREADSMAVDEPIGFNSAVLSVTDGSAAARGGRGRTGCRLALAALVLFLGGITSELLHGSLKSDANADPSFYLGPSAYGRNYAASSLRYYTRACLP